MKAETQNMSAQSIEKKSTGAMLLVFLGNLLWIFIWIFTFSVLILRVFIFQQVSVDGKSMEPNYHNREMLLINQVDNSIQRGEVVAVYRDQSVAHTANYFTRFNPQTVFYLKRVIGLPGEYIEVVENKVIIYNNDFPDGVFLEENYLPTFKADDYYLAKTYIEPDHYFVMGDNRNNSEDSRVLGTFSEEAILGTNFIKVWPFEDLEKFSIPTYTFSQINDSDKEKISELKEKQSRSSRVRVVNI